ncbi:MAG TPA: hypothetical protein VF892_24205, partial [Pseudonocardiaceae bacterium]
ADGLAVAFLFAIVACLIGAVASLLCSPRRPPLHAVESVGAELAAVAADSGTAPSELVGGSAADSVR